MTARVADVPALVEAVGALERLVRAAETARAADLARLAADAVALGAGLEAGRARLADIESTGLTSDADPASLTRGVAAALAATDLSAAVRALRDATAPVADPVAVAALRVRLGLAFRLCAAALAGLAGREAP